MDWMWELLELELLECSFLLLWLLLSESVEIDLELDLDSELDERVSIDAPSDDDFDFVLWNVADDAVDGGWNAVATDIELDIDVIARNVMQVIIVLLKRPRPSLAVSFFRRDAIIELLRDTILW